MNIPPEVAGGVTCGPPWGDGSAAFHRRNACGSQFAYRQAVGLCLLDIISRIVSDGVSISAKVRWVVSR